MKKYLQKRALYPAFIAELPKPDLGLVVTIPCHNEPDLLPTLRSLANCALPACSVEVIVAINQAENAPENIVQQNEETYQTALKAIPALANEKLRFHLLQLTDLPKKHAGVGLARKIAMDEAVRRFEAIGQPKGIIACLDADTLVEANYLAALHTFFTEDEACQAASIHYEHPLEGGFPKAVYAAITAYELHLRYYVHALKSAGLPTATQTVGSSMAVRANAYAAQGGMNRRKAGEDFYFIHKFTPLGGYRNIRNTTIIPSPRISDRVPFGTGRAVGEIIGGQAFSTYAPQVFTDLKPFLSEAEQLFSFSEGDLNAFIQQLPASIRQFLLQENFVDIFQEIQQHTSNAITFEKRFFRWFDAFRAMKFVHFARDHFYPNLSVEEAARQWILEQEKLLLTALDLLTAKDLLLFFRELDREGK